MSDTNSFRSQELTADPPRESGDATAKILDPSGHALLERLGIGGMGEVYRFGDEALERDLAIKILKAELRGNADAEERFLREARLTGSLQHPGVVPIHNLSRLADGRPCYTMKLVRGRTFADMLRDEPEGPERLPRLLAILEKVCQATAYAHSKHVIHRDLKPSNVMVGEFGEVQVMDWGLAKELSRSEPEPPPEVTQEVETAAWTKEAEGLSRAGAALGTPAYMPPEQAAGDWDIVDEHADVFALGAILCEMLTGHPPYHGANREDLLRRARRGDMAEALGRLEKCGSDAVLVELCRECLEAERLQRPRHAGVVAERLASYQAEVRERLRQAELERARAEVKALEERKRRHLQAALALAALLLLSGGAAVWWQGQQRQAKAQRIAAERQDEADRAVLQAMAESRLLGEQARMNPLSAAGYEKAALAAAKSGDVGRAGGASSTVQHQADVLLADLIKEAEEATKDRRLLAALLEVRGPHEGPKYSRDDKDTRMALVEPTAEDLFSLAFRDWGLDVLAVPTTEAVARLKGRPAAVVTEVIAALDEWASQRRQDRKPEAEWQHLTELASALDDDPSSLRRELREILARDRLSMERALGMLSTAMRPVPVPVEVPVGQGRRRLRQLAEKIDPASEPVLGLLTLTRALRVSGEEALAERLLRAALTARPQEVVLYHMLGGLLTEQKPPRFSEALQFYRAARSLRPDLGVTLADALLKSGHADEGLALLAGMMRESPYNPDLHFNQGIALLIQGKHVEAEAAWRKAIALRPDYAQALFNLGAVLNNQQGKYVEAEAALRKAIALKPDYAPGQYNLGIVLNNQGKPVEAEAAFRKAIALKPDDVPAQYNLGLVLNKQGKPVEAEAAFRKAIALKPDYAEAYGDLGIAFYRQGKLVEEEAAYRKSIALKPDYAIAHVDLGSALLRQGKPVEAEAAYRKAVALKPDYAQAYHELGSALSRQGKHAEAEAAHRKAIALKPEFLLAYYNLGADLGGQRKYTEAEAVYRKAIALKPDFAEAYCNLGSVLATQCRFTESLAAYKRGHELGSQRSGWRYPSLQWVRMAERRVQLEKELPAVLQGEAAPANIEDTIILARMCRHKKRYAVSARLYADAFAADPKLAADLNAQARYSAACSAALAAGQNEDARLLPDKVAAMFRRWALSWLRDDLTAYIKLAEKSNPATIKAIQQTLARWRRDPDLASVRDPQALDRLPDNERAAWQALWRDVDELAKRAAKMDGTQAVQKNPKP